MEAHFGRDTETLERTGTDLSHLFCSPCVAKAPQGLFLTRCDNATTRWDKEVERGGTGKPTADEVGQASQLPRWDTSRWDRQANRRAPTSRWDRQANRRAPTRWDRQANCRTRWDRQANCRGGTHRGGTSGTRWDRQANRRAPSKIMDRQAKITILSERCAVLDWVPSSGLDWTPRRTAIIESSRSRATGFRTRRTLLVRRSACRRRRMSARIVSTPLPRARSSHARESRAFQV